MAVLFRRTPLAPRNEPEAPIPALLEPHALGISYPRPFDCWPGKRVDALLVTAGLMRSVCLGKIKTGVRDGSPWRILLYWPRAARDPVSFTLLACRATNEDRQ